MSSAEFGKLQRTEMYGRTREVARRIAVIVVGIAALLPAMTTVATSASAAVKPDRAYFHGKTVDWIVSQAAGGSFGTVSTILQEPLAQYLHATVNLSYVPAGNGIVGQDQVAGATPNGLTIGTAGAASDIGYFAQNAPGLTFSLKKQTFLMALHASPLIFAACPGSDISNWQQVMDAKTPTSVVTTTGVSEQHAQVLFGAYGAPVHFVTSYASRSAAAEGCLHGGGQLVALPVSDFLPNQYTINGGGVRPLLITTKENPGSIYYSTMNGIATLSQYAVQHPPITATGRRAVNVLDNSVGPTAIAIFISTAANTPPKIKLTLQNAFKFIMHKAATLNALNSAGLIPKYVAPKAALANIKYLIKAGPTVVRYSTYGS